MSALDELFSSDDRVELPDGNHLDVLQPEGQPDLPLISVAGLVVYARDTGRVLMLQRALSEDDAAAGKWEFPGGHVEEEETTLSAAVREWQEETGHLVPDGDIVPGWAYGIYGAYVLSIDSEDMLSLNLSEESREVQNPDGDLFEVVSWWSVADILGSDAVRRELLESRSLWSTHEALQPVKPEGEDDDEAFGSGVM